jgi:hypothetical protein
MRPSAADVARHPRRSQTAFYLAFWIAFAIGVGAIYQTFVARVPLGSTCPRVLPASPATGVIGAGARDWYRREGRRRAARDRLAALAFVDEQHCQSALLVING